MAKQQKAKPKVEKADTKVKAQARHQKNREDNNERHSENRLKLLGAGVTTATKRPSKALRAIARANDPAVQDRAKSHQGS